MIIRPISPSEKEQFNSVVNHPLQAYEWGEFREKTGVKVIRKGLFKGEKMLSGFQLTIHKIPHTSYTIGYLPKGELPTEELLAELRKIGEEERCIFIQLEPNVTKIKDQRSKIKDLVSAARPLFTKYTFVLDLTKSEEEILAGMHQKARYNIKVARKNGVEVVEDNSEKAFKEYLRLTRETTERQKFYAHTEEYHKLMWQTVGIRNQESGIMDKKDKKTPNSLFMIHNSKNQLQAHLLVAKYNPKNQEPRTKILTTWILFTFKDILYYPYGASSNENREVMSSNLMMWEAIKYGKKLGLRRFDMWGALGPTPDKKDPWYGFHSFKEKYGPEHVEFIGSYDLIINPVLYQAYKVADKLRWAMLRLKK